MKQWSLNRDAVLKIYIKGIKTTTKNLKGKAVPVLNYLRTKP
jgi:hypothetical protein